MVIYVDSPWVCVGKSSVHVHYAHNVVLSAGCLAGISLE